MTRSVEYEELVRLFSGLSAGVATSMECLFEVSGLGSYIKTVAGRGSQFAVVAVKARPSSTLSVSLEHSWPTDVASSDIRLFDEAMLVGIVEGIVREDWPPMACRITSVRVEFVAAETTPLAVRVAAAMAVRDMCRKPGWGRSDGGEPPLRIA
jgi:hypothetical protein